MVQQYCSCGKGLIWLEHGARIAGLGNRPVNIAYDSCNRPLLQCSTSNTHNCKLCDVDVSDSCFDSKPPGYKWSSAASAIQPIQACCMLAIALSPDPLTAAARGERYNGKRPNAGQRVSYDKYPDPMSYGWTFTGCCNGGRAEFYEKDFVAHGVVKLDFYYTTGTVKTVLDHPRHGVTQLFAKGSDLSPAMYRKILQNPREHTNVRYRTTSTKRKNNYSYA